MNTALTHATGKSAKPALAPHMPATDLSAVLRRTGIKPKLRVGAVDDPAEAEADRVADLVMRMPDPTTSDTIMRTPDEGVGGILRRKCATCEEEDKLHRKAAGPVMAEGGSLPGSAADMINSLGPGQPLPASERAFFEPRFGQDLGHVRVHNAPAAHAATQSINAKAFALGNSVAFAPGEFSPGTARGRSLIAHELAHVKRSPSLNLHRQIVGGGAGVPTTVSLCFVPIAMFHLGTVGGLHAVIAISTNGRTSRFEVDPTHHQGPPNPLAATRGVGLAAGWHSHVVRGTGRPTSGVCSSIPVTPAQVAALTAAISDYETRDIAYGAPGAAPNSNSFAEWVFNSAGISTTSLTIPAGALGWSFYQSNPTLRSNPPRIARTLAQTRRSCTGSRPPNARSFASLVSLLRTAETELTASGINTAEERTEILRGVFYGTPWSTDNATGQSSLVRMTAFNTYAGHGATQPRNPLEVMSCGTYLALAASQDVTDRASGRRVDVGHMLIGMDARHSLYARTTSLPVGGVTGLEASTWAGDLGGAAARVSIDRLTHPRTTVARRFTGSDYGGPINLEGDIAGYAVASSAPGFLINTPGINYGASGTVADAVNLYLLGSGTSGAGWNTRCAAFLQAQGGIISAMATLSNRSAVLNTMASTIESFACWYMTSYQTGGSTLPLTTLQSASVHVAGAAREVADYFLQQLERCLAHPADGLTSAGATVPAVSPAGPSNCSIALGAYQALGGGGTATRSTSPTRHAPRRRRR